MATCGTVRVSLKLCNRVTVTLVLEAFTALAGKDDIFSGLDLIFRKKSVSLGYQLSSQGN